MALSDNDIQLIQMYLGDNLSDKNRSIFDSRLSDLEFKDELLLQSKMLDALAIHDRNEVLDFLNSDDEVVEEKPIKRKNKWLPFLFGLVIGLLITHFLIKFLTSNSTENPQSDPIALVEKYNQVYPAEVIGRGDQTGIDEILESALNAYRNADYKEALKQFNLIENNSETISMYKANCALQLGEYKSAIDVFSRLEQSSDLNISQNADWYTALSFIGQGNNAAAKKRLDKISSLSGHIFNRQAKSLLAESIF